MPNIKPINLEAFVGTYSDDSNNHIETGVPIDINIYGSNNNITIIGDNKSICYRITVYNNSTISIGNHVTANMAQKLELSTADNSVIEIGNNTTFVNKCRIYAGTGSKISIGHNCMFSTDILVSCNPVIAEITSCNNSINVNDYVWVGWGASLQQGCNINKGCIVAAQAVVENEFPANSLIAGDPAKIIRSNVTWHRNNMEYDINAVPDEYRTISNT
ncbi:MAG: hypothetical protein MRZ64_00010 [[Bacteroides] pectinophilus]|nr:hypothetical protein [[Bacteroides] pectinophilus]